MHYKQKFGKLIKILVLAIFSIGIPFMVIYFILKDATVLSSLLNDYINTGKSVFFPSLPSNNLFGENPFIMFSIGHLIDLLIIINLDAFLQWVVYQYYINVCLNRYSLESVEHFYASPQDQGILFGLVSESRVELSEKDLAIKFKENYYVTGEEGYLLGVLRKKKLRYHNIPEKRFQQRETILCNPPYIHLNADYLYPVCESIAPFLNNQYLSPHNARFSDFNYKLEGYG